MFAPLVEDVDKLFVPVICLYEVFKKVNAVADEPKALQAIGQMKQGRVIEVSEAIALRAALISLKHRLPMADGLILATAWSEQATCLPVLLEAGPAPVAIEGQLKRWPIERRTEI